MSLIALLAITMGVGIGTVMALLFAPKDGESMREDLGHMVEKRVGAIEKQVGELRGKIEDRIAELT